MNETVLAPVVRTVHVEVPADRAFHVFTENFGEWWPLEMHGIYGDKAETAVIEPRAGGRVFERSVDGDEVPWGEVIDYDPPGRIVLAWKPNSEPTPPTTVEVTFTADATGTQVVLTHTGWELLGDAADEARQSYHEGWVPTLQRFVQATETG
jgi:uncharacterized protein YndB with AHSA1/START domain